MRGNYLRCRTTRIHVPYPREGKAMLISRCPTPPSFLCFVCLVPSASAVIIQGETRTRRCATRRRKCINVVTGLRTSHLVIMHHDAHGILVWRKRKRHRWSGGATIFSRPTAGTQPSERELRHWYRGKIGGRKLPVAYEVMISLSSTLWRR